MKAVALALCSFVPLRRDSQQLSLTFPLVFITHHTLFQNSDAAQSEDGECEQSRASSDSGTSKLLMSFAVSDVWPGPQNNNIRLCPLLILVLAHDTVLLKLP